MKLIKEIENLKFVIVDMEIKLGNEKRNALTFCVKSEEGYYPLSTANDGRQIFMKKENLIKFEQNF